jgi:hypothetical protein
MNLDAEISTWLDEFADCVRQRDTERARPLFSSNCFSYGTRVAEADGLDALVEHQWAPIWDTTSGFTFEPDSIHVMPADDGSVRVVAARWSSVGTDLRQGRCTLVLARDTTQGALMAVHSHFSLVP